MVDDFMVCVDRIIASACFESVNGGGGGVRGEGSENVCAITNSGGAGGGGEGSSKKEGGMVKGGGVVVECRICQEEDEEHAMEAPCACNGTLKFAHRKCIQRWCNKKGDTTCEICNQVFSPNYSLPPGRSNPDVMAIDIRQAWGPHIDLRDPHFLALAAAERQLLQSEYEDYAVANTGSIACLRSVALILLIVLLIRQALMVTRDSGMVQESSIFFNFQISLLQFAGFLLPCYVMARSWYIIQCRRRRQG
ncbi:uncharacterized protein LOC117914058 [Vitis riparia]|uniref:uncharacterized protein LOC117914058 n=1 Tax=Vitis riparia TaxID=96939 RepID=UPI00155AA673|nr:uncharacterized protein LOC117914058 [Vitis riparia]